LITNAIFVIYGPDVRRTTGFFRGSIEILGAVVSAQSIVAAGIAVIAAVTLIWLLQSTKFGMAVRAVRDDPEYVGSFGVNREMIYGFSFAIAAALAGLAGALIAPVQYVSPYFGTIFLLKAFVIVVMAGLGSMVGVVVASVTLGVLESLAITQFGGHAGDLVFFGVMCLTLLIRPNGLFGLKEKVA
jgi:branched-subunit amino acid ABC-type transport system permease component